MFIYVHICCSIIDNRMKIGVPRLYQNSTDCALIWQLLVSRINQTVELVSEAEYSDMNNLSTFGALLASKIDVIICPWLITDLRLPLVNFSFPVGLEELTLRITSEDHGFAKPSVSSLLVPRSILSVFKPAVWQVLAMLFIGMLLASTNLILSKNLNHQQRQRLGSWRWFSHFTSQDTTSSAGQKVGGLSKASRFLLLVTGLLTLHSLTLYQGGLLAQLVKETRFRKNNSREVRTSAPFEPPYE